MTHLKLVCDPVHYPQFAFSFDQKLSGLVIVFGANGAGKTSFIETIHGMRGGGARWDGQPAESTRAARGFVAQKPVFLGGTARRNLQIAGQILGLERQKLEKRIDELAQQHDFVSQLERPAKNLSGGEAAKLAWMRACLNQPKILLLDEVTANLDPQNMIQFERNLTEFAHQDAHLAIFVTHSLSQAKRLGGKILFMNQGAITYFEEADRFWSSEDETIRNFLEGVLI